MKISTTVVVTTTKSIALTDEQVEDILRTHFDLPEDTNVRFLLGYDGFDGAELRWVNEETTEE